MCCIATRANRRSQAARVATPGAGGRAASAGHRAQTPREPPLAENWLLDPAAAASCGARGPPTRPRTKLGRWMLPPAQPRSDHFAK